MNTPQTDALYASDFHRWDGEVPDAAYHRMTKHARELEVERDELQRERDALEFVIKNALHELWGSPAQTFPARQILRKALGQPQWQIDNDPFQPL